MEGEPEFPRIVRRRSRVHGWGVFAAEPITKNTRIIDYAGELIDHGKSLKRETKYLKQGCIWCFTVNSRWVRDANEQLSLGRTFPFKENRARFEVRVEMFNAFNRVTLPAPTSTNPFQTPTFDSTGRQTDGYGFINHACKPNCYSHIIGQTIWIRASRNIKAGEELTYNYYTDGEKLIPCRCRPGCKTRL